MKHNLVFHTLFNIVIIMRYNFYERLGMDESTVLEFAEVQIGILNSNNVSHYIKYNGGIGSLKFSKK